MWITRSFVILRRKRHFSSICSSSNQKKNDAKRNECAGGRKQRKARDPRGSRATSRPRTTRTRRASPRSPRRSGTRRPWRSSRARRRPQGSRPRRSSPHHHRVRSRSLLRGVILIQRTGGYTGPLRSATQTTLPWARPPEASEAGALAGHRSSDPPTIPPGGRRYQQGQGQPHVLRTPSQ